MGTNPSCHVQIMSTSNFKLSVLTEVMCHGCFGIEEFAVGVHFPLQGKKTQTNQIYSSPFHHPHLLLSALSFVGICRGLENDSVLKTKSSIKGKYFV